MRGAWIEIPFLVAPPRGIRSHPMRGAWIEIMKKQSNYRGAWSRTPCGVRGLKYLALIYGSIITCRTPCGVRGLKSAHNLPSADRSGSHPMRGAWIEIASSVSCGAGAVLSHPMRGAWIEMSTRGRRSCRQWSHPMRGAWIEIPLTLRLVSIVSVAPHAGCVD